MNVSSSGPFNKANVFLGLIEYEQNSQLCASYLVDYIFNKYLSRSNRIWTDV